MSVDLSGILGNINIPNGIKESVKFVFNEIFDTNRNINNIMIETRSTSNKKLEIESEVKKRKLAIKNEILSAIGEDGKKLYSNETQRASAYELYERDDKLLQDSLNAIKDLDNKLSMDNSEIRYLTDYSSTLKLLIRTCTKEW